MTATDNPPNLNWTRDLPLLDQMLVDRHQALTSAIRDFRLETVSIERLLQTRGVKFESFFPPQRQGDADGPTADDVDKFAAGPARPAPGAQPAGGVSGVIPPATPAPPAKTKRTATPSTPKAAKPKVAKPDKAGRSLRCAQCSRTFATYGGLRIHQGRSGHAGELPAPAPDDVVPKTGADELERQPAPPPVVIDDDTMALRCDDCSFAAPVGPIQPLRVHVLAEHSRALSNTERRPRLVVE